MKVKISPQRHRERQERKADANIEWGLLFSVSLCLCVSVVDGL